MRPEQGSYRAVCATALLVMLAGCVGKSPKVTYYTLSPVAPAATASGEPLAIAVGPADFPKTLNRVQIATRVGPNRVDYDEFHRWAGTLDADFLDVTAINLARLLGTDRVVVYPTPASYPVDYRVMFDVVRFESDTSGSVTLEVRWILEDGTGATADAGFFQTVQSATDDDYVSRAAAHSRALGEMASALANEIRSARSAG